ncbi:hypothetical protein PORY_002470 [Pneumocystis oryctolagi]|uniref:Uncharacterized protein n=1 Tax=Pneumocystis oryctolagi TaxID=42067 RepID=A0ACB7C9C2_9ASCO|nr:hypothetical protein PORY_002470 [Pneumocystis oryctolagi]
MGISKKYILFVIVEAFFCQVLANSIMTIIEKSFSMKSVKMTEKAYDSYIVIFRDSVDNIKVQMHYLWVHNLHLKLFQGYEQKVLETDNKNIKTYQWLKHDYEIPGRLRGYSGVFSEEIVKQIRNHEDVEFVEKDQIVHTMMIQKNAAWGLARVSHKDMLNLSTFNEYDFDSCSGKGVNVYIIDTGINVNHEDFGTRAKWGINLVSDEHVDGNGHGTHVAGIVAGLKYGIAKNATVIAIKSDVIKGIEWAIKMHLRSIESLKNNTDFKGSVANLSLGGTKSKIMNYIIDIAVSLGLHFTVAAGNDNDDACNYSPSSSESAITVGAATILDNKAHFSNYGKCVDIFAPGQNIISTWIGDNLATRSLSGTSMASPHVCGLVAYFLSIIFKDSQYDILFTSKMLKNMIFDKGNKGKLHNIPLSTKNIIAYNGFR